MEYSTLWNAREKSSLLRGARVPVSEGDVVVLKLQVQGRRRVGEEINWNSPGEKMRVM
jgi:hypothetical protein